MLRPIAPLLFAFLFVSCDSPSPGLDPVDFHGPVGSVPQPPTPGPGAPDAPAAPSAPDEPEQYVGDVDHPYFPLHAGSAWVYEGDSEGQHRRDVVRVLDERTAITGIECVAVVQEVYLDGELSEITTEWFAQDRDGNVWKFGEDSLEADGSGFAQSEDSWIAGEEGREPWLFLAAQLAVGDEFTDGEDIVVVTRLGATAEVPAGSFHNTVEADENPDDEDDKDIIIYAPSVGLISEQSASGTIQLVEFSR